MKDGTQIDAMKTLALSSTTAALVMARPDESALFYLDSDAFVIDEEIYCVARIVGFVVVGTIGVTDTGIRTESRAVPELDVPGVMAWAREKFCARLCESPEPEITELEKLYALEDTRDCHQ